MVADIAKLSVGREEYYTRELATDHEQHLSGHGESPGRWYGAGAGSLGSSIWYSRSLLLPCRCPPGGGQDGQPPVCLGGGGDTARRRCQILAGSTARPVPGDVSVARSRPMCHCPLTVPVGSAAIARNHPVWAMPSADFRALMDRPVRLVAVSSGGALQLAAGHR